MTYRPNLEALEDRLVPSSSPLRFGRVLHPVEYAHAAPAVTNTLSLAKKSWASYPNNTGSYLHNDPSGNLYFDFPTNVNSTLNYLWNKNPPKVISGSLVITLSVEVTSGSPVFDFDHTNNESDNPPSVRAFLWADNNNWGNEYDRWWAHSIAYTLAPGSVTMTIPLAPDQWSDVFGRLGNESATTLAGFNHALSNVSSLGVTFGGGFFFGHGCFVTGGTARFTLSSYQII